MIEKIIKIERHKKFGFVSLLFFSAILFQDTGLKFIWSIQSISRVGNIIIFIVLIIYAIRAISFESFSKKEWVYYIIPGILISGSMFLNISINVISNIKLVGFFGLIIPWLTFLLIPSILKKNKIDTEKLWRYFYTFLLIINLLGMLDYFLVFSGYITPRVIETPYGIFLAGKFSLFHMLKDGSAHYRYYSCFIEPGSLAMILLPGISYAFYKRKIIGLFVFLMALYLTDSLGGFIGLVILLITIVFIRINRAKSNVIGSIFISFILITILGFNFADMFKKDYERKGDSAEIREVNFYRTITELPTTLYLNPLGFELEEKTSGFEKNKNYSGSNFTPGLYIMYGGILAFLAYFFIIMSTLFNALKSILNKYLIKEQKIALTSIIALFPFIFQRTTIWESMLYSLLFVPIFIEVFQHK